MKVEIHKPIYANYCSIREKYLLEAKRNKEPIELILPNGRCIIDPEWWMEKGTLIEKEFKIPGVPMRMWANHAPIKSKEEELEEFSKQCL
jgi:hypothetical protein